MKINFTKVIVFLLGLSVVVGCGVFSLRLLRQNAVATCFNVSRSESVIGEGKTKAKVAVPENYWYNRCMHEMGY